jgi:arylformamidase
MLKATITYLGSPYEINLENPIDISIPVGRKDGPNAFYLPKPEFSTVEDGGFVGDVNRGGSCNVENISFSPHGNGTHTECVGHINEEHILVNNLLKKHFFLARVVTIETSQEDSGYYISEENLAKAFPANTEQIEALIIRSKPNDATKTSAIYGGTNPAYISKEAMGYVNSLNIRHLLTDLPSVDKEDDPTLAAHHLFFNTDNKADDPKTITEMIYVKNEIEDGLYWLALQIAGFESDASPSRPVLYLVY